MVKMLRELRKAKGITMREFGELFGIAESTVSQYETGKREPDYEQLLRFAEYFDVSVDYLLRGKIYGGEIEPLSDDITFDDFTYALHNETKELTEEKKQQLLEMARFFKQQQDKEKGI